MLTVSQVAGRFSISNRQVQDLMDYGYLSVAQVERKDKHGVTFLFSEKEIENLDIPSLLAEIKEKRERKEKPRYQSSSDLKKIRKAFNYYDRFLEEVREYPEAETLEACFYLFHLNHYAKSYPEKSKSLYQLKAKVLEKAYRENRAKFQVIYLLGADKKKIWLCEDCKENAHSQGVSYNRFIREEAYCPKCYIQSVEKEYYSLLEFILRLGDYRFIFHSPRSLAAAWVDNLADLPRENRQESVYNDRMYLYGRRITAVEERVFPLQMVKEKLQEYLLCKYK